MRTWLALAVWLSLCVEASAATYYVATTGSDGNSCATAQTIGTPKLTVASGAACMTSAGDTLIIRNGTYSGTVATWLNGSSSAYNTVRAETDGGAILTGDFATNISDQYISFEGLRFKRAETKSIEGNHLKFKRVEFWGGPSSGDGALVQVGSNNGAASTDLLFEDVWVHGFGGRYKMLIYNTIRAVLRRVVIRWDGNNNPGAGEPAGNLTVYDSQSIEVQNVIAIDDTTPMNGSDQYGLASICNNTVATSNTDRRYRGVIILNVQQPIGFATEGNCNVTNQSLTDVVIVGSEWGIDQLDGTSVQYTQVTSLQNDNAGFAIFGGSGSVTNSISASNGGAGYTGVTPTGSVSWANGGGAGGGTNLNPYTNGLLYLPRIETGSVLASGGVSGARRGANITHKMGTSGTLHGETGYATVTTDSLWPWPNQARIKQELCTDVSVTRGFSGATSLSHYVWEYLGNSCPTGLCTEGGGGGDTTDPVTTITAPTSSPTYATTIQALTTFAGTASDAVGVVNCIWTNDRGGGGAATGTTTWSVPSITLSLGANVLTTGCSDAADNSGSDVLTVTFTDTTAPSVSINTPTSSPTYATSTASLVMGIIANDDIAPVLGITCGWTNDRGGSGTFTSTGGGQWSSVSSITLQLGVNVLTATCTDASSNARSDILTVTYTAAGVPPTVTAVSPIQGRATGQFPITLTGTGFVSGATVAIGGVTCPQVSVVSATTLTCLTAGGLIGTHTIVVTNPDKQSGMLVSGFTYLTTVYRDEDEDP